MTHGEYKEVLRGEIKHAARMTLAAAPALSVHAAFNRRGGYFVGSVLSSIDLCSCAHGCVNLSVIKCFRSIVFVPEHSNWINTDRSIAAQVFASSLNDPAPGPPSAFIFLSECVRLTGSLCYSLLALALRVTRVTAIPLAKMESVAPPAATVYRSSMAPD